MGGIPIKAVDKVEITILADNYSDLLLPDTEIVKRLKVVPPNAPLAEHGLSCLVTVYEGEEKQTVLMDAGISGTCVNHNGEMLAASLGVMTGAVQHKLSDVETMVLSHGHFDHFAGLPNYLEKKGENLPVILHPGAFVDRRVKLAPEFYVDMPKMAAADLEKAGAIFDERQEASTISSDRILVTGHVARVTDFEKGSPGLEANVDGTWVADPFEDDQGIAIKLKGKGLVIIGGCSHAGIINTIEHVRNITETKDVYAVMGGFHLGNSSETLIDQTVAAMQAIGPDIVIPMHCTGWHAINRFADKMPDQFLLNSVGTTYVLAG
jgi:7,8-dihydropterin-6-yl-methyl-4-(beta-D-ribofuranosyl)aminobenzene 5'-phosphate synthase